MNAKIGDPTTSNASRAYALLISIAVTAVLDAYSVYLLRVSPGSGISWLYPGIAFIIVFGIWFGLWGAVGAYIGTVIGGVVSGVNPDFVLLMKTANFVQAIIPALAYRHYRVSSDLSSHRSVIAYIMVCIIVTNLAGATVGTMAEGLPVFGETWLLWFLVNVVACVTLLPVVMLSFSRVIEESWLYVRGWW